MADTWQDRANRGLALLDSNDAAQARTICLLNKVLDTNNSDGYISRDFYNVQQTAGGLPEGVTFASFLDAITGHVRDDLMGSSFASDLPDDDVKTAIMAWDANILRHFTFLNGTVHQIAAGEVHVKLWNLILDSLKSPTSIYSCYASVIVDDR